MAEGGFSAPFTSLFDLVQALEAVISSADPTKREVLAQKLNAYSEHFPEDYFWAFGAQAPTMLHYLMWSIDGASRPESDSRAERPERQISRCNQPN